MLKLRRRSTQAQREENWLGGCNGKQGRGKACSRGQVRSISLGLVVVSGGTSGEEGNGGACDTRPLFYYWRQGTEDGGR